MATYSEAELLSQRAQENLETDNDFQKFVDLFATLYNPVTNPQGVISLGVAENGLMQDELADYFNKISLQPTHLDYGHGPYGSPALRTALSTFINNQFHPFKPVEPSHLVIAAGVTATLDLIAYSIADENDAILIGRPLYTSFRNDLGARAQVSLVPVCGGGVDPLSVEMVGRYEEEFLKQRERGVKVRGIVLCNPHNPLGKCYSKEAIVAYMRFCQKYRVHLISDEIYALSIFTNMEVPDALPFISVLSISKEGIIDESLVHVLYGMSKDFGSNGLRLGVLISQANTALLLAVKSVACFSWTSSIAELFFTTLLNDQEFLDFYLKENSKRLGEHYKLVTEFLDKNEIEYMRGENAGLFIWVDFRSILGSDIFVLDNDESGESEEEGERRGQVCHSGAKAKARDQWFNEKLMEAGVYLGTGDAFFSEQHGWYRITFSIPRKVLDLGLGRLQKVIDEARAAVGSTSALISIRTSHQAAD